MVNESRMLQLHIGPGCDGLPPEVATGASHNSLVRVAAELALGIDDFAKEVRNATQIVSNSGRIHPPRA